jgi:hypothetical protein
MIGAACNSGIPLANLHAVLNFVHAIIAAFILFKFEILLKLIVNLVQNVLKLTEKKVL